MLRPYVRTVSSVVRRVTDSTFDRVTVVDAPTAVFCDRDDGTPSVDCGESVVRLQPPVPTPAPEWDTVLFLNGSDVTCLEARVDQFQRNPPEQLDVVHLKSVRTLTFPRAVQNCGPCIVCGGGSDGSGSVLGIQQYRYEESPSFSETPKCMYTNSTDLSRGPPDIRMASIVIHRECAPAFLDLLNDTVKGHTHKLLGDAL